MECVHCLKFKFLIRTSQGTFERLNQGSLLFENLIDFPALLYSLRQTIITRLANENNFLTFSYISYFVLYFIFNKGKLKK